MEMCPVAAPFQSCSLFARLLVTGGVQDIPQVSLVSVLGLGLDRPQERPLCERRHDKLVFCLCWA